MLEDEVKRAITGNRDALETLVTSIQGDIYGLSLRMLDNRLISKFRQPIESLFNWIIEKTGIQKASKVRSTDALLIHLHCWGKLVFALLLLVFYY